MKISYVLILFFFLKFQVLKSQDFMCGMPPPTMEQLNDQPMLQEKLSIANSMSFQNNLTVNVVFHISNNLITFEKTTEMMNVLNSAFEDHNISFNRLCVNFSASYETLPYAINIYVSDIGSSGVAGYAGGYGSNYLVIHYGNATSSTLPHEMGHCLYLFHTHNEVGCPELVNGSNCVECGDHVCDTPADPKLYTNRYWVDSENNCTYTGTFTDANGASYNPDTRNLMSYSPPSCRDRFTSGQGERMYNALLNLPILIPVTKPPEIQGPNLVCSSAQFTFFPSTNSISWSSSNSSGLTIDPSTGVAIRQGNFNGSVSISATHNAECGLSITKIIWVGEPTITYFPPGTNPCFNNPYYQGPNLDGLYYTWSVDNQNVWFTSGNSNHTAAVISNNPEYFTLSLTITDGVCTLSNSLFTYTAGYYCQCFFDPSCGGMGFARFSTTPNPADDQLVIEFEEEDYSNQKKLKGEVNYSLTLIDNEGNEKVKANLNKMKGTLDISKVPAGTYYLKIEYDGTVETRRILIKH